MNDVKITEDDKVYEITLGNDNYYADIIAVGNDEASVRNAAEKYAAKITEADCHALAGNVEDYTIYRIAERHYLNVKIQEVEVEIGGVKISFVEAGANG